MAKFDTLVATLQNEVFAIEPNYASALLDNYKAYKDYGKSDTHTAVSNEDVTYQVVGKTAVIAIDGVMYKKSISGMCGGSVVSYDQIIQTIDEAENDTQIETIMFRVDTRGGSVAGADEVRDRISNSPKETITYFENIGASGGMWIFTASDKVYSNETTMLGSIGVIVMYQEPKEKVLAIVSSNAPNKVCDISDEKCKNKIQTQLNQYESIFLDRLMSAYPNKSAEDIVNDFDKGAVIFADTAHKLGYLDGVMSFNEVISLVESPSSEKQAINQPKAEIQDKGIDVNELEELQAQLDTANATIEANKTEIEAKGKEVTDIQANNVSVEFVKEVLAMGGEYEATSETLIEMMESKDLTKSELIAVKAQNGALKGGTTIEAGHQDNIDEEPKSEASKEELQELLDGNE